MWQLGAKEAERATVTLVDVRAVSCARHDYYRDGQILTKGDREQRSRTQGPNSPEQGRNRELAKKEN